MSTLVLLLPPRPRLRAQGSDTSGAPPAQQTEYDYLLTPDGVLISDQGRRAASSLPRAETVIALAPDSALSWFHLSLPKAGLASMRAALAGAMEEALLDDPENLHFALEPGAAGGSKAWVAVMHKDWLAGHLARLEAAHVFVDRVAPVSWPQSPSLGHFHEIEFSEAGLTGQIGLRWSSADGVADMPLDGSLARQLFPVEDMPAAQWTATPVAAEAAQAWLGSSVTVVSPALRSLAALNSAWNLRQFELAARARGVRALRQLYRGFMRGAWRPVRIGLAGLVIVQLVGINLWAWHQRSSVETRRAALEQVLRSAHPQVRAILDPGVQMQRETALLRTAAGRPGDDDLESLLGAAANAWPADRGPLDSLRFEPGRLTLSSTGWRNDQIEAFRKALSTEGWQLEVNEGRFVVSRARNNKEAPQSVGRS